MLAISHSTSTEHSEAFQRDGVRFFFPQLSLLLSILATANQRKFSRSFLFFFPFLPLPTKESSYEFLFLFLLSIFPNGRNTSKSIVDRASQQGSNARTHLVILIIIILITILIIIIVITINITAIIIILLTQ